MASPFLNVFAIALPPVINSESAIVFEPAKGQIVFEKDKNTLISSYIGGNILTVLLAIEKGDPANSTVTISKEATLTTGIKMDYEAGSKVQLDDLMYALLLGSANDAAYAIAEHLAPTPEKFLELMNAKAAGLNMKDTTFKSSGGFYPDIQTTTAYDISLLMRHAVTLPKFNDIISTRAIPLTVNGKSVSAVNNSRMYWIYEDVAGSISQYSTSALQNAVTIVKRGNTEFISVALNGTYELVFDDSVAMLNYAFNNFKTELLVTKNQIVTNATIADLQLNLLAVKDTYYTFPIGENFIKTINVNLKPALKLPITVDNVVGTVQYVLNDGTAIDVGLLPDRNLDSPKNKFMLFMDRLNANKDILVLLYILCGIGVILLVTRIVNLTAKWINRRKA